MRVPPISQAQDKTSFGIYRGLKKTPYGEYTWGVYKGKKIEIYDVKKDKQKLIYVSNNKTLRYLKYKFTYIQNGVKRVSRSSSQYSDV